MAKPKDTIWALEPHTRAKHEILRRYLQAWLPILGLSGFPQFIYIDGFAGPGKYIGDHDGSPIIALKAAIEQQARLKSKKVFFRFIEEKPDRAEYLTSLVDVLQKPDHFDTKVINGVFETEMANLLTRWTRQYGKLAPTFAFIDPFGWKAPLSLVVELMQSSSCEVLVTFMYEEINRFIGLPEQAENFDRFFGCTDWREGIALATPALRNKFLHDLYTRQLRSVAGVRYVRSFEMRNDKDLTDYFLFFATNNITGLKKMKEAMWKVSDTGEFRFSDATDPNQGVLFSAPTHLEVRALILENFSGRKTTVGDVEEFIVTETPYRETHFRKVLAELEKEGHLSVFDETGRRVTGFSSPGLVLTFS